MALFRAQWMLSLAAALLAVLVLALMVVISPSPPPLPLERVRIGYAVEAPYAFLAADGEVTGESPEIAHVIATKLGITRIEWIQTNFASLLADLELNRFDVVAAGMFITAERAARVTFSRPSFHAMQALLVRRGNPHRLHSYADVVARPDVKIAVVASAVEETLLSNLGLPRPRLIPVPDTQTGLAAVMSGLADGLALSSPTIRWMSRLNPYGETEMAIPFRQVETAEAARLGYGAFAFRPRDRALADAWNTAMAGFIGTAEHRELVANFGFTREEVDNLPTVDEILAK
jgi:polar amino acid transport system substrate-binding protein